MSIVKPCLNVADDSAAPFPEYLQLYPNLEITEDGQSIVRASKPPKAHGDGNDPRGSLRSQDGLDARDDFPCHPTASLMDPNLANILRKELTTPDLDTLTPYLWLVSTRKSSHVTPLTHQSVLGRQIIVTERADLHLIWYYNRVFIKPIPKYLLSHAFWTFYFGSEQSPIHDPRERKELAAAARGLLRSYAYLIQNKSDFRAAQNSDALLISPKIKYRDFARLIKSVEDSTTDAEVSPRWSSFGELRLTRLNFWSKIFLHRLSYTRIHGQYAARFAEYAGPIIFIFGIYSVALGAMQTGLGAEPGIGPDTAFTSVSWGFSVFSLASVVFVVLLLLAIWAVLMMRELIYSVRDSRQRRRRHAAEEAVRVRRSADKDGASS